LSINVPRTLPGDADGTVTQRNTNQASFCRQ